MKYASIKMVLSVSILIIAAFVVMRTGPMGQRSCFTFLFPSEGALLVGHNLDENMKVPGLIVINPRGVSKENISYSDIKAGEKGGGLRRLRWVSKYGSLTYNVFGKEFPDGGLNEAGLYVGEMTLMGTEWPAREDVAGFYHHHWMQYLLDNFATVDEALSSLSTALPEGHCQWHFFLADKNGKAAVVEFIGGKPVVYSGEKLPYTILGNDRYDLELKDILNYKGFGGGKDPAPKYEKEDPRFRWAALMFREPPKTEPSVDFAFRALKKADLGNNKWTLVYDITGKKLYFRTSEQPSLKWIDISVLDFSCSKMTRAIDIHQKAEGDSTGRFAALDNEKNAEAVKRAWAEIDAGFAGNAFWKPKMVKGQIALSSGFKCSGE
ncbi:MAG TPA: linear amide C-N hydrolase [Acidobacteriota bacterium]|nr:linear amide C-N hydrolase [Acidobacteriota bacterium]HQQ47333.1 linear amide C-N hydrolase [Acidobacteriota bacterium]